MRKLILVGAGLAVVVAAAGAVLAVRALHDGPAQADPQAQVRLRVSVEQWRTDEVGRTVQVAMRNDGPLPVRVLRVELRAPSFAGTGPVTADAPLPPGGLRVDVRVPYGTGRCAGDLLNPTSAPAEVALRVRTADGQERAVRVPLAQPNAMLDKLLRNDCQQELLRRAATVGFGPWTVAPDGSLRGTVTVVRSASEGSAVAITLHEVSGNVVYDLQPVPADRARPLGVLAAGQPRLAVPILIDTHQCSGHVLGEAKKPYVFPAWLSLAGGPKLYTEVTVDDSVRGTLTELVHRQCHL